MPRKTTVILYETELQTLRDALTAYRGVRTEDKPWMRTPYENRLSPTELDRLDKVLERAERWTWNHTL